jgi:L-threonylcarbamoyladenylate synthase
MRQGGVIAYPTEAVYGLGCDPFNRAAVDRLLAFKGRRRDKGLLLIAAEFSQVAGLLEDLQPKVLDRVAVSWPGFVTWVLPVRSQVPGWLSG